MRNRNNRTSGATDRQKIQMAVDDVAAVMATAGITFQNKELANNLIGLESLNDMQYQTASSSIESLKDALRDTSLAKTLFKGFTDEQIDVGLEAAAYTLMTGAAGGEFYAAAAVPAAQGFGAGQLVHPNDGSGSAFALESFDPVTVQKYLPATAVANARAAILGDFEETFFPQQLVPAGQNGVDVYVTIPKVFTLTPRTSDAGGPYNIVKTSLIQAVITPSVLESNATTLVPYATGSTGPTSPTDTTVGTDPYLIAASVIPTTQVVVDGIAVNTRPIVFGKTVDIIQLSNAPGLITVGVLDETDALDPIVNVGKVFYDLTVTTPTGTAGAPVTISAVFSQDVSNQVGTLLTQVPAGRSQALQTTANVSLFINNSFQTISGTSATTIISTLESVLGLSAGAAFNLVATANLAAQADTELGNLLVNANQSPITAAYGPNNSPLPLTLLSGTNLSVTVTPLGYLPAARRTNSNLRQNGTIVDSNTTKTFRFPVNLSAPIISQSPIGGSTNTTLEGLSAAARIRQNGRAVVALQNAELALQTSNGITAATPIIGSEFVVPTYVNKTLDVTQFVTTVNSQENLLNLRGALTSAITNAVNQLLIQSNYPAALELTTGSPDSFEIIVVTDQEIAPHIWESGDIRTFGDTRKYVITKSNNSFFKGKIYFSFRRSDRSDEIHPLDFGRMLVTPPLTYDVAINRNGRTTNEIHTIPRVNAYVTLPILGVINVLNLETLYAV